MKNTRILSLEDDPNLALVMRHYIEDEGHNFTLTSTAADCMNALAVNKYDVLLMDLGLPDSDGLSLIPRIREKFTGPIIIISGKTDTMDRIVGLEMGADDYITKPFEMRELVARIKANLRRPSMAENQTTQSDNGQNGADNDTIYRFDGWTYAASKLSLQNDQGEKVELTSGECEILELFLNSHGRALSREYLFEQTRGDNFDSYDRSIDIQVTRLRKKMGDDPQLPKLFKTIRGVGYMFIADVKKEA